MNRNLTRAIVYLLLVGLIILLLTIQPGLLPEDFLGDDGTQESDEVTPSSNSTTSFETHFDPLIRHVREGNVERVKSLLNQGADPNMRSSKSDYTPLIWAATLDEPEVAKVLLEAGADPYLEAESGKTANIAFDAAIFRSPGVVRVLLKEGADTYLRKHRQGDGAYLMNVARNEANEVLGILLEHGFNPNNTPRMGRTPLMIAMQSGNYEAGRILISHGADVTRRSDSGQTALFEAASHNFVRGAKLLLRNGADVNARANDGSSALFHVDFSNKYTEGHHLGIMKFLLEEGADPDLVGEQGTILHRAAEKGKSDAIALLARNGAAMNVKEPGEDGSTPLFTAIRYDRPDAVRALLEHGADPTIRKNGLTCLHRATIDASPDVAALLGEHGAPINARDRRQRTALHFAVSHTEYPGMIQVLLELGVDVRMRDNYGKLAVDYVSLSDTNLESTRPFENLREVTQRRVLPVTRVLPTPGTPERRFTLAEHQIGIGSLRFSPDSSQLLSGGEKGTIHFIDTDRFERTGELDYRDSLGILKHLAIEGFAKIVSVFTKYGILMDAYPVNDMAFRGDEAKRLIVAYQNYFTPDSNLLEWNLSQENDWDGRRFEDPVILALHPETGDLIVGERYELHVVEHSYQEVRQSVSVEQGSIQALEFSPSGDHLMVGTAEGSFYQYSYPELTVQGQFPADDRNDTGFNPDWITDIEFFSDGRTILTAGMGGKVAVWKTDPLRLVNTFGQEHYRGAEELEITSDDGMVVGTNDVFVRFWSTDDWTLRRKFRAHNRPIEALDLSPNDRWIATGVEGWKRNQDNTVKIWTNPYE